MNPHIRTWIASIIFGLGMLIAGNTHATVLQEGGGTACTGNSAFADAALRKTAIGLTNTSSTAVYVTCALQTVALHIPPNDSQHFSPVQVGFLNNNIRPMTLKCTLVVFVSREPMYYTGQASAAVGATGLLSISTDSGRFSEDSFSISCLLPSHVTLQWVSSQMLEFQFIPME